MIKLELDPRTAAQLFTLLRIGGNACFPMVARDVRAKLVSVMENLGAQLEPHNIPVEDVVREMFPTAEVGYLNPDGSRPKGDTTNKETIQ